MLRRDRSATVSTDETGSSASTRRTLARFTPASLAACRTGACLPEHLGLVPQELPTAPELADHPELASLALLDTAIELATTALAAQHPGLGFRDEHRGTITADLVLADAVVRHTEALQALLGSYCRLNIASVRSVAAKPTIVTSSDDF